MTNVFLNNFVFLIVFAYVFAPSLAERVLAYVCLSKFVLYFSRLTWMYVLKQDAPQFVRVRTSKREVLIAPQSDSPFAIVTIFDPSRCPPKE